jgi:hypothetical protein
MHQNVFFTDYMALVIYILLDHMRGLASLNFHMIQKAAIIQHLVEQRALAI